MHKFLGRAKFINPLGHKTILGPSAQGWFCVLRWNQWNCQTYWLIHFWRHECSLTENILSMLKYSRLFSTYMICRSVLFLSAIHHCTRVLFPIKRHGIRKQRPYANAFLLCAAKFFFWSVCHWSNFELSTDDQHWNGCSRQKRGTQCIYSFLFFCSIFCTLQLL